MMLVQRVTLHDLKKRARREGLCRAHCTHLKKECTEERCRSTHHHAKNLLLLEDDDPLSLSRVEEGELHVYKDLLCIEGCPCECHVCDPVECEVETKMRRTVEKSGDEGEEGGAGASGIAWGLIHPGPQYVHVPSPFDKYFLLDDIRIALSKTDRPPRVEHFTLPDKTLFLCGLVQKKKDGKEKGKGKGVTDGWSIRFEAVICKGRSVFHRASVLSSGGEPFILSEDVTDPKRACFAFPFESRREKAKAKDFLETSQKGGYTTFLCYLALRMNGQCNSTFSEMLNERHAVFPGETYSDLLKKAKSHLESSLRLSPTEEVIRIFNQYHKGNGSKKATQAAQTKNDNRIVCVENSLLTLRCASQQEGGSSDLCYNGATDISFHEGRTKHTQDLKTLARGICESSKRSSSEICFNVVKRRRIESDLGLRCITVSEGEAYDDLDSEQAVTMDLQHPVLPSEVDGSMALDPSPP